MNMYTKKRRLFIIQKSIIASFITGGHPELIIFVDHARAVSTLCCGRSHFHIRKVLDFGVFWVFWVLVWVLDTLEILLKVMGCKGVDPGRSPV